MIFLTDDTEFPSINESSPEDVVAIGGDLAPERLMNAYKKGIFPWFEEGSLILWWCPDPRMVLFPADLKISKSMNKVIKSSRFTVTYNQAFSQVIENCSLIKRKEQDGTWITQDMISAYNKLYTMGYAKSVEVWEKDTLVGGLYGIDLGHVFCGESMFSKVSNASKTGFISMVQKLKTENCKLIDCQVYTNHLASLGAKEISRSSFLKILHSKD
ncbi:leucyl/phenylalanyl-tRNA--protein transferase [Abyssalbus ytuae]|uniref:Leucyl/phenylalanyl-tRNA--protein transferase n=1 Tax=Abyssalbus ytuae TaxID=2926907 RepID=A0A9E6ZLC2_9FLAO|nr:leucyl/phenylalanyl-tRNA--protein transferase [Abyssalbus ytuae]UOB16260.1 leucyl/phenylalanyl-tRNA--protein transferase [Abyssalbus ytuae]